MTQLKPCSNIFSLLRLTALKRLKAVCDAGFISVLDFETNPLKVFAAHELAVMDPSMGTKMTVQVRYRFTFTLKTFESNTELLYFCNH